MDIVIRSTQIIDPSSPFNNLKKDILVSDGIIKEIDDHISFEGKEVKGEDLHASIGWLDMRAHYQDPGHEHKEDLESGSATAAAGGFTDVVLLPNNDPVTSSKNAVSYFQKWSKSSAVQLYAMAAVTLGCEGKELTEMIDLHVAGAVAFGDGIRPIWHTDIMMKGLQYMQKFDGLLVNKPEDKMLTAFGHMNEGMQSTQMGLKGIPSLSEAIMIERDLKLLEYTGGRLHFTLVSTQEGVRLIRNAKAKGLTVTCDVGINYLKFTDLDLSGYQTNLKVNPPYRTEEDRQALLQGLKDGTIDCIVTDHIPHDEESKKLEFDLADFGSSNQQSFLPVLMDVFGNDYMDYLVKVTSNPRRLLGMEQPKIDIDQDAVLTIFNQDTWTLDARTNKSKSVASPFYGKELKGHVKAIINKGQLVAI